MTYKEIYEELNAALLEDPGFLLKIYNPFHDSPGDVAIEENLICQDICRKFAAKLYLETKDEYAVEILKLICNFVGETIMQGNVMEGGYAGQEYDPTFMFDSFDLSNVKEPVPGPVYEVTVTDIISGNKETKTYKTLTEAKEHLAYVRTNYDYVSDLWTVFKDTDEEFIVKDLVSARIVRIEGNGNDQQKQKDL